MMAGRESAGQQHHGLARMDRSQVLDQRLLSVARDPGVIEEHVRPLDLPARLATQHGAGAARNRAGALLDLVTLVAQPIDLDVGLVRIMVDNEHSGHWSTLPSAACVPAGSVRQ